MSISILNWAIAKTILERDRPDADPADINRLSVVAALVPGVAGLLVPFVVENNLPGKELTEQEIRDQIKDAKSQIETLNQQVLDLEKKLRDPSSKPIEPSK